MPREPYGFLFFSNNADLLMPLVVGVALFLAIMATASRVEEGRQNTGAKIVSFTLQPNLALRLVYCFQSLKVSNF